MLRASTQGLCSPLPAVCGRSSTLLAQTTCRRTGVASQAIRAASSSSRHHHQCQSSLARQRSVSDELSKEVEQTGSKRQEEVAVQYLTRKGRERNDGQSHALPTISIPSVKPTTSGKISSQPQPFSLPPPLDVPTTTVKSIAHLRNGRSTDRRTPPHQEQSVLTRERQKTGNDADDDPVALSWRPGVVRKVFLRATHPKRVFATHQQCDSSPVTPTEEYENVRKRMMFILSSSPHPNRCWDAYERLHEIPFLPQGAVKSDEALGKPVVPFVLMHRLCRVLATERPVRQSTFVRLHSILAELHAAGGPIHLHEWNALINSTGRGVRRKVTSVDYETALSFYRDMTSGLPPGATLNKTRYGSAFLDGADVKRIFPIQPDIYTYTSLIHLAARTTDPKCVRHAVNLLENSGSLPTRITHLSLVPFFLATKQFTGLRSTLWKMEAQDLPIGIDGLNAFLWSYARNGRQDVVMMIYRLLRYNVAPTEDNQERIQEVAKRLEQEEYIQVPKDLKPNSITYTAVLQSFAYQGRFRAMLTVFLDMVSSPNVDKGAPLPPRPDENGVMQTVTYNATMAAFRSVFMGFARFGVCPREDGNSGRHSTDDPGWALQNLDNLFEEFLTTPNVRPSPWVAHWILLGYKKTSGGDTEVLGRVWKRMEERFGQNTFGSEARKERLAAHFLQAKSTPSQ